MKTFLKAVLFVLVAVAPGKLLACATCYGGNIDTPMTEGMNAGIFTLLGVIGIMIGTFVTLLVCAIRKSEAVEAAAQKNLPTPEPAKV